MKEKDVKKDESGLEIMIGYSGDVAYIGKIDPDQFEYAPEGLSIYKPFVLNIRPVTNEQDGNKLEAVVLDMMLPVEFAGLPLTEQLYTGFVNFTQSQINLSSGKSVMMDVEGGKVFINRLSSLANIENPVLWLKVNKLIQPSDDLIEIYNLKAEKYEELLIAPRMVDLQAVMDESPPEFNMNQDSTDFNKSDMIVH